MQVKTADIDEIRRVLEYNRDTGVFTRKIPSRTQKVGDVAGSRIESSTKPGKFYIRVGVLGRYFWAHRLAVAWVTDKWPTNEVDHKDQNSENNAWGNLVEVTKNENAKNLSKYQNNTSGFPGVSRRPNGKYRARITINTKSISLGDWDTPEEAVRARNAAKKENGFHENHC